MNFIKALEKAQALGMTKDEFIGVWEAELKLPPLRERSGEMLQVSQDKTGQSCTSDKLGHQVQQGTDTHKQELHSAFQALLDKHTEQQQHMWQEVHNTINQTAQEYKHRFEILCQHVTNTVETQTSSLKLYFMQELEIMNQNLGKMIDDRFNKYEASALSSAGLQQIATVDLNQESGNTERHSSGIDNMKDNMVDRELLPGAFYIGRRAQNEIQQEKQQDSLPGEVYNWHVEETLWQPPKSEDSAGHTSKDEEKCEGTNHNLPSRLNEKGSGSDYVEISYILDSPIPDCEIVECMDLSFINDTPTKATGFYAKAISDQIKRNNFLSYSMDNLAADDDWESGNKGERDGYSTSGGRDLASSQVFKHVHWDSFNIPDIATYGYSNISYMSPFLHPGTHSWKARLSISFGAERQLKVHVCITEGDSGGHHEWPTRITANGFIFHFNSKRYTQVWALPWVTCPKPSAREVKFPAKICLATKRGNYPDVTYDELEAKHYFDNKAVFKWNLKAEKRS